MRCFAVCVVLLVLAGCGARQPEPRQPPTTTESAVVNDGGRIGLIVSTVEGRTAEAATALRALGGHIESSDDKVGYLRVTLPADSLRAARKIPSIEKIDTEGLIDRGEPT
jgi:hypothetical protein